MIEHSAGPTCQISRLPCGVRLVTESMADVASVAIGFWVGTGSRDESDQRAGASHFLEHLLFKGSESRSAADIAEAVDEVGGDCNAFTAKEYTAFYIRLLAEGLDLGVDILSDIIWTPALRQRDLEAERSVILDEILMHADEPTELAAERFVAAMYPGHPLGRDTLGTPESIGDTTVADIRSFLEFHYRPNNIVVAVAGDCRHDQVGEAVERRFAGIAEGSAPIRRPPEASPAPLSVVARPTEQAHLVLGARSVSLHDDSRWAVALFNQVLGGGLSSRLFQKVREERGLAYSVGSERQSFCDTGSLAMVVGTAPGHAREVLRIAVGELDDLAEHGATERELAVAKSSLRAEILLSNEDSGSRMSRIGASLLVHDQVLSVDEVIARIDAVEPAELQAAAAQMARAPKTLSAVGPLEPSALGSVEDLVGARD